MNTPKYIITQIGNHHLPIKNCHVKEKKRNEKKIFNGVLTKNFFFLPSVFSQSLAFPSLFYHWNEGKIFFLLLFLNRGEKSI